VRSTISPGHAGTVSPVSWEQYLAKDPAELVQHDDVVTWVRTYRHGDAMRGLGPFTGGFFDDLGHRGEPDPTPDQLAPADLLALEMLDARVAPEHIPWLLEDPEIRVALARIPADARIWDDDPAALTDPWRLADLVRERHGLGESTITKLLARKRPHLIPVVDDVVSGALQPTRAGSAWLWRGLRERLGDPALRDRLADIAIEADGPGLASLRVLDIAIRMQDAHARRQPETELGQLTAP
jgi:hypothetical protein